MSSKITKYQIAKRLGISHQAVYKWYNGKSFPSVKNLIKLSKITGENMEDLVRLFRSGR